jgi:predicted nuclease of predicted toxin-antitoxin system
MRIPVGDENLTGANDEAVADASRSEDRILVTLDLDFDEHPGVPAR